MSQAESIPGVIAFVVLSDIALVAVFVWIGIAIVVGARDAFSSKEAMTNFIFTITPIIVVVISMFFGIFFNNYGIVNHKKSDLFFSTLYFTYLLLVAFSAFPGVLFSCSTARSASASSFSSSDDPERNEFVKGPDKVVDNADDDDDDENVKQRLI